MSRLSLYLLRLFSAEAMAIFAVATFLLFLTQLLRLFDSIAARGQGLLTLVGQSLLGVPTIGIAFLYICLGIGLGRALRDLQTTSELGIIHSSDLLPGLLRAVGLYTGLGMVALLLLAHIVDPAAQGLSSRWSESIAAELVGRTLVPHKFMDLVSGVTVSIAGRNRDGSVTGFFADDSRGDGARRTYIAETALIAEDERGFALQLHNGVVQYQSVDKEFSEFSFERYDLALDRLTTETEDTTTLDETTSPELIQAALASGTWSEEALIALIRRSTEALRVAGMCLLVTALAAFPTAKRRRFEIPIELVVLGVAFAERGFTANTPIRNVFGSASGGIVLFIGAAVLLLWRLRAFRPVPRRRPA
ncbi:MAG: LptF/LptG family permease [Devosia sp.]